MPQRDLFLSLLETQDRIGARKEDHNSHRPHSSLGQPTPSEFATQPALERVGIGPNIKSRTLLKTGGTWGYDVKHRRNHNNRRPWLASLMGGASAEAPGQ